MPRLKSIDTSVFIIRILLSCIGMSLALSAYAQDGTRGRVLDEQGKGLDAAVVMLASLPDNVLMETTITDSNGQYLFPVHNGKFLLCIKEAPRLTLVRRYGKMKDREILSKIRYLMNCN